MELNGYQKAVIKALKGYVAAVRTTGNLKDAWSKYWGESGVSVGFGGMRAYVDQIEGVPNACIKVPTGGGKTFIAANALKVLYGELPHGKTKFVLWLVPSEAILTQTTKNLQNPGHPYRQRLNADFGGKVNVYTKDELLNGQNFSPDEVAGNLSVCVFCYASVKTANVRQSDKKIYHENANLMKFAQHYHDDDLLLAETPDTALIQVIRQLNPVVVVDESHNAKSELSVEMLKNVNPSFVLSMTATPDEKANIIACVDARELKKEHMVKLPVFVYNRPDVQSVISDAVAFQGLLEAKAKKAESLGGRYIRPVVLFQAQPKTGEDAETFAKIKARLVKMKIEPEKIAIKTSQVDELKGVDLMSPNCPVRFIITVNALKEGWDCPFAYILASLANKTSKTDVEQIVGRVLRQPYARESGVDLLNMSFVMTSSNDFNATVENVVAGLNKAGFSKSDFRTPSNGAAETVAPAAAQGELPVSEPASGEGETGIDDLESIPETATVGQSASSEELPGSVSELVQVAEESCEEYEKCMKDAPEANPLAGMGVQMDVYKIDKGFVDDVAGLRLPQFMVEDGAGLFSGASGKVLLTETALMDGFRLDGQDANVDFNPSVDGAKKIDLSESGESVLKCTVLSKAEMNVLAQQTAGKTEEERIRVIAGSVAKIVDGRVDSCPTGDVRKYVEKVLGLLPATVRAQLAPEMVAGLADRIVSKIFGLQSDYRRKVFEEGVADSTITCEPNYSLPPTIAPVEATNLYPKSLYTSEYKDMDNDEIHLVEQVASLPNVRWWHRIRDRKGFCINGYRKHYPDFMIRTESGRIVLVEMKGNHLDGSDAKDKFALGKCWEKLAGFDRFRYFMVFRNKADALPDSFDFDAFLKALEHL